MVCAALALTVVAHAADAPCSVDAAASNGEGVHFEYLMENGVRTPRLYWSPPPHGSPLQVRFWYSDVTDASIGNVNSISVLGQIYLAADTPSNTAELEIVSDNEVQFEHPVFLRKGPAYTSKFGVVLVNFSLYDRQPTGHFVIESISSGTPATFLIKGDQGDILDRNVVNYAAENQRDTLVRQARKLMATALSQGCTPITPLLIRPVSKPPQG